MYLDKLARIFFYFIVLSSFFSFSQQTISNQDNDAELLLTRESSFSVFIHTQGWGGGYRSGKQITGALKRVIEINALKVKDPREIKVNNPGFGNSKGYYYGKLNAVGFLRGAFGLQRVLYRKEVKSAIEIRMTLVGGPVFGFAKPIYLEILKPTALPYEFITVEERYNPEKHYVQNIYGKAPFVRGINQMKVHPGVFCKFSLSFDYASVSESIKSLETGVMLDYFPQAIPMMAYQKSNALFVNLFVAYNFGKKRY